MEFRTPWTGSPDELGRMDKAELTVLVRIISDMESILRGPEAPPRTPFWQRHFKGSLFQGQAFLDEDKVAIRRKLKEVWAEVPPEAIQMYVLGRFNAARDYAGDCADAVRACLEVLPLNEDSVITPVLKTYAETLDEFPED